MSRAACRNTAYSSAFISIPSAFVAHHESIIMYRAQCAMRALVGCNAACTFPLAATALAHFNDEVNAALVFANSEIDLKGLRSLGSFQDLRWKS